MDDSKAATDPGGIQSRSRKDSALDEAGSAESRLKIPEPLAELFKTNSEKNFLEALNRQVKTNVKVDEVLGQTGGASQSRRKRRNRKRRESLESGLPRDDAGRDDSPGTAGGRRRRRERRAHSDAAGRKQLRRGYTERSISLSDDPGPGCINKLFGETGDPPGRAPKDDPSDEEVCSSVVVDDSAVISVELHENHRKDEPMRRSGAKSKRSSSNRSDSVQMKSYGSNGIPAGLTTTDETQPNGLNGDTISESQVGRVVRPPSDLLIVESGFGVTPLDTAPLLLDDEGGESALRIISEIALPFLLAGLGCVVAGLVLDHVKEWRVFLDISEIFILVPALLGLKGNLEMTLASRLSTQANIGNMDKASEQWNMIAGNLALTQAQAIIVGLLAAVFAIALGWVPEGKFNIMHGFLLCTGSVLTAAVASFVLGSVMVGVIVISRKFKINPDNVATPIAASLGDLTTISLLAGISMFLYNTILDGYTWITPLFLCIMVALIPLWWIISHRNIYTNEVLYAGWTPVIGAMIISSIGGLVLDHTVASYEGIAVFQPVINGVGGNLVAVQASRLSTALHRVSTPGILPDNAVQGCPHPLKTFLGKGINSRTARVLLLMVIPGQVVFMFTISFAQSGGVEITFAFVVVYLTATVIQVAVLLFIANWLVHLLWQRGIDPDNSSIPYLTAIGDLLGTVLLAASFFILSKLEPNRMRPVDGLTTAIPFLNVTVTDDLVTTGFHG